MSYGRDIYTQWTEKMGFRVPPTLMRDDAGPFLRPARTVVVGGRMVVYLTGQDWSAHRCWFEPVRNRQRVEFFYGWS